MADERAVRAAEKLTHRANGCEDIGGVLDGVRERRAATIAAEYADVLAENERLKEFEEALKQSHNGYDATCRESMPTLTEPKSPKEAIESLLVEAEEIGRGVAEILCEHKIAALEQHVTHLTADAAETDHHIREAAKRVLPAHQVDGDSVCVPPLEEVVDAVVQQVAELRELSEARKEKMITCCFCNRQYGSLARLQEHSAECEAHPLFKQVAELRADAERWRGINEVFDAMKGRDSVSKQFLLAKAEAAVVSGSR